MAKEPRHKRLYKDSPKLERGESGKMEAKKPSDNGKRGEEAGASEKEADKVESGTDGMAMHESHAASRRSMHHRHMHEHAMLHHEHELAHASQKGAELHEKHEKEYADMHKRHHTEMKSLHKSHGKEHGASEEGGEKMIEKSKETAE